MSTKPKLPGEVRADACYTLRELGLRLGVGDFVVRQWRRLGSRNKKGRDKAAADNHPEANREGRHA